MSCHTALPVSVSRPGAGRTMRETSSTPKPTSTACAANGQADPTVNRAAPMGGPTSWLTVMKPTWMRELARARSSRSTSMGSSVLVVLSAKTSAVARRNRVPSTSPIDTVPVAIAMLRRTRSAARATSTVMTISLRLMRSESAPAQTPNSRGGSHCRVAAEAMSRALWVSDATSSGPAASEMPSPVLLSHDDASSHRKLAPSRFGATASTILRTTGRYPPWQTVGRENSRRYCHRRRGGRREQPHRLVALTARAAGVTEAAVSAVGRRGQPRQLAESHCSVALTARAAGVTEAPVTPVRGVGAPVDGRGGPGRRLSSSVAGGADLRVAGGGASGVDDEQRGHERGRGPPARMRGREGVTTGKRSGRIVHRELLVPAGRAWLLDSVWEQTMRGGAEIRLDGALQRFSSAWTDAAPRGGLATSRRDLSRGGRTIDTRRHEAGDGVAAKVERVGLVRTGTRRVSGPRNTRGRGGGRAGAPRWSQAARRSGAPDRSSQRTRLGRRPRRRPVGRGASRLRPEQHP